MDRVENIKETEAPCLAADGWSAGEAEATLQDPMSLPDWRRTSGKRCAPAHPFGSPENSWPNISARRTKIELESR